MQKRLIVLMLCVVLVSATAVTNVVAAKQVPTTVAPQAHSLGEHFANYFLRISNVVLRSLGIQLPPGATVYPGTIQRINSFYPDYTLTYTDASNQKVTVYVDPASITGGTLPSVIPNPVALDYVYNIDTYHYTLSFSYQGVTYSAHWATTTHAPYLSSSAKHCLSMQYQMQYDKIYGTVYINSWNTTKNAYVQTPAGGVAIAVYVIENTWGNGPYSLWGTTTSGSDGRFSVSHVTSDAYWGSGYVTYNLAGYPPITVTSIQESFGCDNY